MSPDPNYLLARLEQIGASLSQHSTALALIGLGSVGQERDRLDQYSDLDFFVIVSPGSKRDYLDDLTWLTNIAPVAFYFANTPDGYKLLYKDGVFCEFAVFTEKELSTAVFSPGRMIWKADGVDDRLALPLKITPARQQSETAWLVGEALINLYVGLSREARGEKLSALRFIQGYAVDRIIELVEKHHPAQRHDQDAFDLERRFETRYPDIVPLGSFLQGYNKNCASALAILAYLDQHYEVNPAMQHQIARRCQQISG